MSVSANLTLPQRATMNERAPSLATTVNESSQLSLSTLMASFYHRGRSRVTLFFEDGELALN
jgi:hypothetical protein